MSSIQNDVPMNLQTEEKKSLQTEICNKNPMEDLSWIIDGIKRPILGGEIMSNCLNDRFIRIHEKGTKSLKSKPKNSHKRPISEQSLNKKEFSSNVFFLMSISKNKRTIQK